MSDIKKNIKVVPNFPIPGVSFKDITPILENKVLFKKALLQMADLFNTNFSDVDVIVGIESRGFIFASVLAFHLQKPLHLVRKKGKLPPDGLVRVISQSEYATVELETKKGKGKALIVDDVLATGGTLKAAQELLEKAGFTNAGSLFFINLKYLNTESHYKTQSLVEYENQLDA